MLPYTVKLAQTRSGTTVYYKDLQSLYTNMRLMRFCSFSRRHGDLCAAKRTRFADVCSFPHRHGIHDAKNDAKTTRKNDV